MKKIKNVHSIRTLAFIYSTIEEAFEKNFHELYLDNNYLMHYIMKKGKGSLNPKTVQDVLDTLSD